MPVENKNILVVGGGGREHALGWKLKRDNSSHNLYFARGNAGTAAIGENVPIDPDNKSALARFAKQNYIDVTVVGPDNPVADGIVDEFKYFDLKIFGPTKEAAFLEASKSQAMLFMRKYGIPHPDFEIFSSHEDAVKYVKRYRGDGMVVKADGLAQGKGVFVCDDAGQAKEALKRLMINHEFEGAGKTVVIQEKLQGQEISLIAFTDGKTIQRLPLTRDHKTFHPGGSNTGGVATFAPVTVSDQLSKELDEKFLYPTIRSMRDAGKPYQGAIYFGIMLTKDGPKALEINCRFGDPETQPQMLLLADPLLPILESCIDGTLDQHKVNFQQDTAAACVVLASDGYPEEYTTGLPIHGLEENYGEDIIVFHAGTRKQDGQTVTAGGRVLGITSLASTVEKAFKKSLSIIGDNGIRFAGMQYRKEFYTEE